MVIGSSPQRLGTLAPVMSSLDSVAVGARPRSSTAVSMTFREFWPLYLEAHSQPATRAVHYGATIIGLGSGIAAAATGMPLLLLGIGVAYALAIGAHVLIERNQSMIRVNPIWGAIADLRMTWLAATGGLAREIEKSRAMPHRRRVGNRYTSAAV